LMRHRLLLVLLSTSMLGGCANWFETSSRPAPSALTEIHSTQALKVKWTASVSGDQTNSFLPAYTQGSVVVANNSGRIQTFNADTGRADGTLDLKRDLTAGVGVSPDLFLVGTADGTLLAVDRTSGKLRWEQPLTSVTLEAPVVGGQVVVVRTNDDRVTGFSLTDGKQLWSLAHFMPQLTVRNTGSLNPVGSDVVLAGLSGGDLQVIAQANGNILWDGVVATPKGATELERITDVVSRPLYNNGQVCAVAYQGRVACFDSKSGNLTWARDVSSSHDLAMDDSTVYVTADDDSVWAFDRMTGRNLWKQDALKYRSLSAPTLLGRYVLVVDAQGIAHLLSNEDGSIVGRAEIGAKGQTAQLVSLGSSALVKGSNGRLVMLSLGQ
jgi:outer membrane protein assembly factor BamB